MTERDLFTFQNYDPVRTFANCDNEDIPIQLLTSDGEYIACTEVLYSIGKRAYDKFSDMSGCPTSLDELANLAQSVDDCTRDYLLQLAPLDQDHFDKYGERLFSPTLSVDQVLQFDWVRRALLCAAITELPDAPILPLPDSKRFLSEDRRCLVTLYLLDEAILLMEQADAVNTLMGLVIEIHELTREYNTPLVWNPSLKKVSKRASDVRHKKNREYKKTATDYYVKYRSSFNSRIACARDISEKLVPVEVRTVDGWLKDHDSGK